MKQRYLIFLSALIFAVCETPALAHPGHSVPGNGFSEGLLHPLLGWDHLLALFAIGLLSAQFGGVALWLLPSTFVLSMIGGGVLGMLGSEVIGIEYGIAISVLILGLAVAFGKRFSLAIPVAFAAGFGFVHGQAHGAEMPHIDSAAMYAVGFVFSTILMHCFGLLIGLQALKSANGGKALRLSGAVIAALGCWFILRI